MKLKKILTEIGDRVQIPPGARFIVGEHKGTIKFNLLGDSYTVEIRVLFKDKDRFAITSDFYTAKEFDMTNKNAAFTVMSMVVGSIEAWLKKYNQKFGETGLTYIKYSPKSEEGEVKTDTSVNIRDRIYRKYIESFAKKYNSSVTFSFVGGIVAKFEPNVIIK